jgi:hypothetical protein
LARKSREIAVAEFYLNRLCRKLFAMKPGRDFLGLFEQ